jgi:hypothetical protein
LRPICEARTFIFTDYQPMTDEIPPIVQAGDI